MNFEFREEHSLSGESPRMTCARGWGQVTFNLLQNTDLSFSKDLDIDHSIFFMFSNVAFDDDSKGLDRKAAPEADSASGLPKIEAVSSRKIFFSRIFPRTQVEKAHASDIRDIDGSENQQ